MPIFHVQVGGQGKAPDGKTFQVPSNVAMQQKGAVIPVTITIEQNMGKTLAQQGKTIASKQGLAIIDTGASRSAIDEQTAKDLGLPVVNVGKMTSASHEEHPCNLYPVQFSILPNIVFQSPQTMGATLGKQGYIGIIGRDILGRCVLIYDGVAGQITLSI
jgi:Aspartyl protease